MEKDTRFDPVVFEMAKVLDRRKAEDIILLDVCLLYTSRCV